MYIKYIEIVVLLLLSLFSDAKYCKIKNIITMPFIIIGIITNFFLGGYDDLLQAVFGVFLPVGLLFIFSVLKMIGAGDVKLFAAVGSIMGLSFVTYSIAYSFLCGGILSIIVLIVRKNAVERFMYFFQYLKTCIMYMSLLQYQDFNEKNSGVFRFSYAIACGVILQIVIC